MIMKSWKIPMLATRNGIEYNKTDVKKLTNYMEDKLC